MNADAVITEASSVALQGSVVDYAAGSPEHLSSLISLWNGTGDAAKAAREHCLRLIDASANDYAAAHVL
eukprot:CAMPEP_0119323430 /NCGR_PEP_ID=MMETSP1333-20130426/60687_1 /TAXON_ID=418940 /ORGANISM="Scyphosphaera apsteinii, Strain RCC1455" /LENGTH=68 /DNA_ID=CAMNT_0007330877 /DNA_START=96 /DNA_END=302 /DNA_ORIENTATION=+